MWLNILRWVDDIILTLYMVFLALMLNSRCGWIGDCRQIYPRQFSRIFKQPNHIRSFFNAVISNIRSQVFRFKIISKSYFVLRVVPAHLSRPRLFPTRYAAPKRDTQPTLVHPGVLLQQMVHSRPILIMFKQLAMSRICPASWLCKSPIIVTDQKARK